MRTYYIKYNIETGLFIADAMRKGDIWEEVLVTDARASKEQIKALSDIVKKKFARKKKVASIHEVQIEFERLLFVCDTCDKVLFKAKHNKSWGSNCRECHQLVVEKKAIETMKKRDFNRQLRKYKLHYNTPQGKVDAVPIQITKENTRLELRLKGHTFASCARALNLDPESFRKAFNNRTISRHLLAKVAFFLKIPLSRLIRKRKFTIPIKHGVPAFWLEQNFKIRYYDEELPERF